MPEQSITLATALKSLGYATGQFGKNHLGDLNKYLPTLHGFDEFFGYLYHLDAMSDPYSSDYPQNEIDNFGPRNVVHCWATDVDDPTVMPRWGKVGKQRFVDEGPLAPFPDMTGRQTFQQGRKAIYNMWTFDQCSLTTVKPSWIRQNGTANRFSFGTTPRGCTPTRSSHKSIRRR
jgi:arylsulfatase